MHQRLAFFDATRTGELLNRLSNDVTQVSKTLSADTSYFLRNFAQVRRLIGRSTGPVVTSHVAAGLLTLLLNSINHHL